MPAKSQKQFPADEGESGRDIPERAPGDIQSDSQGDGQEPQTRGQEAQA